MGLTDIGKTIRAARQEKGLTQARLAEMAGVSRATVNNLERGTIKELGFGRVDAIMRILGYELAAARAPQEAGSSAETLRRMARRYIWWQRPGDSIEDPRRIVAQVMDLGTLEDIHALAGAVGKTALVDALSHARPGWFRPRSWAFWHTALGLPATGGVPPMPARRLGDLPRPG